MVTISKNVKCTSRKIARACPGCENDCCYSTADHEVHLWLRPESTKNGLFMRRKQFWYCSGLIILQKIYLKAYFASPIRVFFAPIGLAFERFLIWIRGSDIFEKSTGNVNAIMRPELHTTYKILFRSSQNFITASTIPQKFIPATTIPQNFITATTLTKQQQQR